MCVCVRARGGAGRAGTGAAGGAVGELALVGRAVGPREPACRFFCRRSAQVTSVYKH